MVQIGTRAGVKIPSRFPRHPPRTAHARGRRARRADRRRGGHRARVLRRRPAPGDQGRRTPRGPQRAATAERAHRRGDRLWPRQRGGGRLRGLRPRRRHVRHLDPAAVARRVRGARHQRRLGARRRRLRPPRVLLGTRGRQAPAARTGRCARAARQGARGQGDAHRARGGADPRAAVHRRRRQSRAHCGGVSPTSRRTWCRRRCSRCAGHCATPGSRPRTSRGS